MGFTLFGRWGKTRNAATGGNKRPARLHLEALEARLLPSLTPHLLKDISPGLQAPRRSTLLPSARPLTSWPTTGCTASNYGKATALPAGTVMVKDINPGGGNGLSSNPDGRSNERQRHAVLPWPRQQLQHRTLEEQRHCRGHRAAQASVEPWGPDERQRHAVLRRPTTLARYAVEKQWHRRRHRLRLQSTARILTP